VDNQNSPASLQRITISIRNKLRYLQGAPSVAMQEIPPNLEGLLADEDRTPEEKDEDRGTAYAGERRSDRTMARNEFFDGENDVDHDVTSQSAAKVNTTTRKTRPVRRSRARTKGKGATVSSATPAEGEDDTEESAAAVPVKKGRARARARGRGRPKNAEKEKDNPEPDTSIGMDADVDI